MAILIDTHRLVNTLKDEHGFSLEQAEGVKLAIEEINLDHVATKSDIDKLRVELFKWLVPLLVGQVAAFTGIVAALIGWFS